MTPTQSPSSKLLIALLVLLLLPFAHAADTGGDGITVYSIESAGKTLFKPLAIVLAQGSFKPGDVVSMTVGSDVPCNTKTVTLNIMSSTGGTSYFKDVTSLFYTCSTSYVKMTFSAPTTPGTYTIGVTFKDSTGAELYTDKTVFTVSSGTPICPAGYCTTWSVVQRYEHGTLDVKSCYTYAQTTCAQTQSNFNRITCDSGFVQQGSNCVSAAGTPTCGDRVVQSGEECDMGVENGVCPSICNTFCKKSNCAAIPSDPAPTAPVADTGSNGNGLLLIIGSIIVLAIGVWIVKRK